MAIVSNGPQEEQVNAWAELHAKGLGYNQIVRLYTLAFHAVATRSLATLSEVTLKVVLDRALNEGMSRHRLLSEICLAPQGFDLGGLLGKAGSRSDEDLEKSLRYLLLVLLTVLGNITAQVLTASLQAELAEVTRERALQPDLSQNLRVLKNVKTNREDS